MFVWNFVQIIVHTSIVGSSCSQWGRIAASCAICDEGSGLILGEWHSQGYDHMLCCVCFAIAGTETIVTLKVFLWRFAFNSI